MKADVTPFFDEVTRTATYVVADPEAGVCAVIDSVLDYDPASGRTSTANADKVIAFVTDDALSATWILETHAHDDHLTAACYLKEQLGARTGIGAAILRVQQSFAEIFNCGAEVAADGSQWDRLSGDGDAEPLGELRIEAMHTPGHTPACSGYLIADAVFTGDTIFMPDFGTARCDFPGASARQLCLGPAHSRPIARDPGVGRPRLRRREGVRAHGRGPRPRSRSTPYEAAPRRRIGEADQVRASLNVVIRNG